MVIRIKLDTKDLSAESQKWFIEEKQVTEKFIAENYKPIKGANRVSTNSYDLTVILCNYNTPDDYLRSCFISIKSWYKVQLIIINDGGNRFNDELLDILPDNIDIFIYDLSDNVGIGYARDIALNFVNGKYLTWLDPDDYFLDGAIDEMLDAIMNTDYDAISYLHILKYEDHSQLDKLGWDKLRLQSDANHKLITTWMPGTIFSSDKVLNYHMPLVRRYEDSHGIVVCESLKLKMINEPIFVYRQHSRSILHDQNYKRFRWIMSTFALYALMEANENYGLEGLPKEFIDNYIYLICKGYPKHLLNYFARTICNILEDKPYRIEFEDLVGLMTKTRDEYDRSRGLND